MQTAICTEVVCGRQVRARGLCIQHYTKARSSGMPKVIGVMSLYERLMKNSIRSEAGGCWIWQLKPNNSGYGSVSVPGAGKALAHRASYEHYIGTIPDGLVIDHLCRNRLCINPDHLEAVSQAENVRRSDNSKTHCKNGHPLTEANILRDIPGSDKVRRCKKCRREYLTSRRNQQKENNAG